MKLSIIIPTYNTDTTKLIGELLKQKTDEVEIILVDDGSKVPVKDIEGVRVVRHERNLGVSSARNTGIENSTGEYIAFIDADDMVSAKYVDTILEKIDNERFDYCYISWKSQGSWKCKVELSSIEDSFPPFNLCVWNRIYRRDMIGSVRFNVNKKIAEDAQFIKDVKEEGKKSFISDILYYYNSDTKNSLTKRFSNGEIDTDRVVYYYPQVTSNMKFLIKEFEETNKYAEIILMTYRNDIPELQNYAMVIPPSRIRGTELRGTSTPLFTKINKPIRCQILIYTSVTFAIGGIETFTYNFCRNLKDYYDIVVLYDKMDKSQILRLSEIVRVVRNSSDKRIECEKVLINRITDEIPSNVKYQETIQMVHACKMMSTWEIPSNRDHTVCVSEVVKNSFDNRESTIIHNMTTNNNEESLLLVSATRLSTFEKGLNRVKMLIDILDNSGIKYHWLIFSDTKVKTSSPNVHHMGTCLDISTFVSKADYLVQLSDEEGFCYSIVEALELGTPVITTPIKVLDEIGFKDGENGYVVPFDMKNIEVFRFLNKPKFEYKCDNDSKIDKWKNLLGMGAKSGYDSVKIRAIRSYSDINYNSTIGIGEVLSVDRKRAQEIISAGYAIMEEE